MEGQVLFIINPIAGQGAGRSVKPEIERLARENNLSFDIIMTEFPGHAIELSKQATMRGVDLVVAVGGDGTSNEVLNGLMQASSQGYTSTSMGIIGIGRGNDFAFGFGIPRGLAQGFKVIIEGKPGVVDVGYIIGGDYPQGRYFGNGVGIGFDAVVGFEALKLRHLHGFLNYIVAALRTIFLYFNAPLLQIDYENERITQPSLMVSIMNGKRMGGGFMMAPEAHQDDGLLDICIAGQLSRMGILLMIPRFMNGTQASQSQIKTGRAAKIHVSALEGSLPVHADGETICTAGKEVTIEIIHNSFYILH
jgi:diacylglycerol kinase (ATP)